MEVVFLPDTRPVLGPLCRKRLGFREAPLREHLLAPCPKGQSSFCWTFYHGSARQFNLLCQSKQWVTGRRKEETPNGPAVPRNNSGMYAGRRADPQNFSWVFSQYGFVPSAPRENKQCVKPSTSSGNRHLFPHPLFFFRCCRRSGPISCHSLTLSWLGKEQPVLQDARAKALGVGGRSRLTQPCCWLARPPPPPTVEGRWLCSPIQLGKVGVVRGETSGKPPQRPELLGKSSYFPGPRGL